MISLSTIQRQTDWSGHAPTDATGPFASVIRMELTKAEIEAGLAYCRWLHMRAFNAWMQSERAKAGIPTGHRVSTVCLNGTGERVYRQVLDRVKAEHTGGVMLKEAERKAVVRYLCDLKDGRARAQTHAPKGRAAVKHAGVTLTTVRKFVAGSGERRISGVASSISEDREGDIVVPSGGIWRLPVPLLHQHSHRDPLGKVTKVEVRGGQLWFEAEFAQGVARVDEIWRLVEQGALDSLSIGFRGLKWSPTSDGGRRWDEWELLEISVVAVGMNPDAKIRRSASGSKGAVPLVAAGWRRH